MNDIKYLSIHDFLKKRNTIDKGVFVSRTNDSYLIGPIIDFDFDYNSFYRRITSSCVYKKNLYKKVSKKISLELIKNYYNKLCLGDILEVYKSGIFVKHKFFSIPKGNKYE